MPIPLQFSRYVGSPDHPQLPDRPSKASPGSGFASISARPSCVRFGAGNSNPNPIPAQCIDRQAGYQVGPNLGPLVCQYCWALKVGDSDLKPESLTYARLIKFKFMCS